MATPSCPSSDSSGAAPAIAPVAPLSAPAKRSFYDLPAEVRVGIYEMLFCYSKTIHLRLDNDGNVKHARHDTRKCGCPPDPIIPVHLFTVAKELGQEAAAVLYQSNKFSMGWENLNDHLPKWDQGFNSLLGAITIFCGDGPAWGIVPVTRKLADKMPGLREIEFRLWGPLRLAAAALETSSAITPCASMFPGPDLELVIKPTSLLPLNLSPRALDLLAIEGTSLPRLNPSPPASDLVAIRDIIRKDNADLADIWPQGLPASNITRLCAPNLSLIRLSGRISRVALARILQHTCPPGDCVWMDVDQGADEVDIDKVTGECEYVARIKAKMDMNSTARSVHYKWTAMDPRERTDVPEVDMRQWHPPLSEREKQKVREFAIAFGNGDNPSHAIESASAILDPVLQDLQELPFADYFEDLNCEWLHKTPEEIRNAWMNLFGTFTLDDLDSGLWD